MKTLSILALAVAVTLSGCGGGGGNNNSEQDTTAEGYWATYSDGISSNIIIEPNGNIWNLAWSNAVITPSNNYDGIILGAGKIVTKENNISGSMKSICMNYTCWDTIPIPTKTNINGTFIERYLVNLTNKINWEFKIEYDKPLNIIPGYYKGESLGLGYSKYYDSSITISNVETLTGNFKTCEFDGVLTKTNKNYERVNIKFHGGSCYYGTQTLNGIILSDIETGNSSNGRLTYILLKDSSGNPIGFLTE